MESSQFPEASTSIEASSGGVVDAFGEMLALLSTREREVVDLASNGRTDEQIAQSLDISSSTVNSYGYGFAANWDSSAARRSSRSCFASRCASNSPTWWQRTLSCERGCGTSRTNSWSCRRSIAPARIKAGSSGPSSICPRRCW
ncbi:LuxR family transcriptional regulator [bacterium]|nr:MAG: LuxR family transcriptional regulator [bacterium]